MTVLAEKYAEKVFPHWEHPSLNKTQICCWEVISYVAYKKTQMSWSSFEKAEARKIDLRSLTSHCTITSLKSGIISQCWGSVAWHLADRGFLCPWLLCSLFSSPWSVYQFCWTQLLQAAIPILFWLSSQ